MGIAIYAGLVAFVGLTIYGLRNVLRPNRRAEPLRDGYRRGTGGGNGGDIVI